MERNVDITTGDSVAFTYELAGLGSRFFAVFIDIAIQAGVALSAAGLLLLVVAGGAPHAGAVAHFGAAAKLGGALALGLVVAAGFVLFDGYFILFEWLWCGRTPGKRVLGIRVVRDGGFALDFTSSFVRNAIRILEFGLGFYAVSAVATLLSERNRRLGDMAAGTIVVRDVPFERMPAPLPRESNDDHSALIGDLTAEERDLIRRYAARRDALAVRARSAVAADIAGVVRPRLGASFAHLDDDTLLTFLATTTLR